MKKAFFVISVYFFLVFSAAQEISVTAKTIPGGAVSVITAFRHPVNNLSAEIVFPSGNVMKGEFFPTELKSGWKGQVCLFPIDSWAVKGTYQVKVAGRTLAGSFEGSFEVVVEARSFVSETIPLNPVNTTIKSAPNPEREKQTADLNAIIAVRDPHAKTAEKPFLVPVDKYIESSHYADRRIYAYSNGTSSASIHSGIDMATDAGTPVLAASDGKIVMARDLILTGNTVILEVAPKTYLLHYHMSVLSVMEGDLIKAGDKIGEVGSTGLSTGAHLHWEMRMDMAALDPLYFTTVPLLDKGPILDMIDDTL